VTPPDAPDGERTQRIGPLKLALFALIPVTILVLIAEVAAAITISREARVEPTGAGSARVYRMRTGSWPWSRRVETPINSDGFPDTEFPAAATPKRCLHVVLLGDSFVLGDGVDGDSSFTSIVGRALATRPDGSCVRTFNLGERGSTVPRQARRLRELRPRLRPDVVILAQYQNDLTDLLDPEPRDLSLASIRADSVAASLRDTTPVLGATESASGWGVVADRFGFLNPRLVRFLAYHAFAALITNGIHRDELRHWSVIADTTRREEATRLMSRYESSFDSLATELARDSIGFGVVILPSKFDVMAGRFPEESFFTGLASTRGVPALSLFPIFDRERSPYAFLMYDGHLNERGNELVAHAILEWVERAEPAPFGRLRATARR
jgi:hypothetical protein